MRTGPERDVVVRIAVNPDVGAARKRGCVAGGRPDRELHHRAGRDRAAGHLGVLPDLAGRDGERVDAQDLFDRARDEGRVGDDPLPVARVGGEVVERVAERGRHRIEARHEHEEAIGGHLVVGDRSPVDLETDRLADQVVARLRAALGDDRPEVVEHRRHRRHPVVRDLLRGGPVGVQDAGLPGHEARQVLRRQPHQAEEDGGRVVEGEVRDHVAFTPVGERVDQLGRPDPDAVVEHRDGLGREGGPEQPPPLAMLVAAEHVRDPAVAGVRFEHGDGVGAEGLRVLVRGQDVLVPGEHVVPVGEGVPHHRRVRPQPVEELRPFADRPPLVRGVADHRAARPASSWHPYASLPWAVSRQSSVVRPSAASSRSAKKTRPVYSRGFSQAAK